MIFLRSLKEICSPLEDKKSAMFFKITYVIAELCGPPLVRDYPLIFANDQQVEVSKLKYKWEGEFDNLSYFSNENIKAWTVDYVYINSNTSIIINEV